MNIPKRVTHKITRIGSGLIHYVVGVDEKQPKYTYVISGDWGGSLAGVSEVSAAGDWFEYIRAYPDSYKIERVKPINLENE